MTSNNSDDTSMSGTERCDLCRTETRNLRPVCVVNRVEIPLLCSDCSLSLEAAGRIDRERDAREFGYSAEAIKERIQ
jgi:hypothetical protein